MNKRRGMSNVSTRKAIALFIVSVMIIAMAVPALGFADTMINPLGITGNNASQEPNLFHVDYVNGTSVIKSVDIQIPEGADAALLPAEAFPTDAELANVIGAESQVAGWVDISDDRVYTQEELMLVEMFGDKVFEVVINLTEQQDSDAPEIADAQDTQAAPAAPTEAVEQDSSASPAPQSSPAKAPAVQSAPADTNAASTGISTQSADASTYPVAPTSSIDPYCITPKPPVDPGCVLPNAGSGFSFKVEVTAASRTFNIPTSGMSGVTEAPQSYSNPYNWNISWGDSSATQNAKGYSDVNSLGIAHTYSKAGTYTITIYPVGTTDAWLSAFGFWQNTVGCNIQTNKAKVVEVITPLVPLMTRSQAQIKSNTAPANNEWLNTFTGCTNLTMGSDFTFDATAWSGITSVGNNFAREMFENCNGAAFTMNSVFNLPQNITTVGNQFAAEMFQRCNGAAFKMNSVFNLPKNIKTSGNFFATRLFYECHNDKFGMNSIFNLPQNMQTTGTWFGSGMFMSCSGISFTMNDAFNAPQGVAKPGNGFLESMFTYAGGKNFHINNGFKFPKLNDTLVTSTDTFARVFLELNKATPVQARTVQSIINGNIEHPATQHDTFTGDKAIFSDWSQRDYNWGCGGLEIKKTYTGPKTDVHLGDLLPWTIEIINHSTADTGAVSIEELAANAKYVGYDTTNAAIKVTANGTKYTVNNIPRGNSVRIKVTTVATAAELTADKLANAVKIMDQTVTGEGILVDNHWLQVTYSGNGATGNPPVDPKYYKNGEQVTVLGQGDLTKDGGKFAGWSSNGNTYIANSKFNIKAPTTLTAIWDGISSLTSFTKQVSVDGGNTYVDGISITNLDQVLTYKVAATFPTDMGGYKTVTIQDKLPDTLIYKDGSGKVLIGDKVATSADGTLVFNASTNTLTFEFASNYNMANLSGKTVQFILAANVNKAALTSGSSITIKNVANIFVNGNNAGEDGDTSITVDNQKPDLPSGFKKTLASGQDATIALNETNQPIDYEISFKLPTNLNGYKNLKITDTLPAGMDVSLSNVKVTVDGAASPLPSGLLTKASNTITLQVDKASIPANIWNALPGKTIVLHVRATFTSTANPKIGDVFTNTARIFLNGEKVGEDEQPIIIGIAAGPTDLLKSVSTDGGKTFNADAVITSLDTPLIYRVNVTFPADMSGYDSVAIADELPASLVYVTGSGKVVVDGKTPAATDGSLSFDTAKNTLTYTFADNYDLKKLAGKSAQLYLDAKINEKAIANGATVIKNVGHLILNEAENPAPPTNFKKVVAAGQSTSISDITKPVSYSISATMPTDMKGYKSIKIQDIIPAGMDVNLSDISLNVGSQTYSLPAGTVSKASGVVSIYIEKSMIPASLWNMLPGKNVAINIKAKFTGTPSPGAVFTNIAQIFVNGDKVGEDNEVVKIPSLPTGFAKTLANGQNANVAISDITKPVSYNITATLPLDMTGYQSLLVQDVIPTGMDIATSDVSLTVNGQAYSIPTGTVTKASGVLKILVEKDKVPASIWNALPGKTVVIGVKAKFTTAPKIGDQFVNRATLTVNGEQIGDSSAPTVKIVDIKGPASLKKYVSIDGGKNYADTAVITSTKAALTYKITVTFPTDMNGYNKVAIVDDLPNTLVYTANSGKVFINGTAAAAGDGVIDVNTADNTVTYTFANGYNLKGLAGKTVDFIIGTTLNQNDSSTQGPMTIKNTALFVINDGLNASANMTAGTFNAQSATTLKGNI